MWLIVRKLNRQEVIPNVWRATSHCVACIMPQKRINHYATIFMMLCILRLFRWEIVSDLALANDDLASGRLEGS